jgi:hypothetical protein
VAGSAGRGPSRERITQLCGSLVDARTLRLELLAELRQMVQFDAYAWLLTDPETSIGASPLADVPCLPELPRLTRLKYLTKVNRWTQLRSLVALLARVTGGDLSRSLVWRELLHRYDIVDIASLVFRDGYGCWGFLELWQSSMSGQFGISRGGLSGRRQRSTDHRPAPQSGANLQGPGGTPRAEPWSGHVAAVATAVARHHQRQHRRVAVLPEGSLGSRRVPPQRFGAVKGLKPSIPQTGLDSIPIRHELELELPLP